MNMKLSATSFRVRYFFTKLVHLTRFFSLGKRHSSRFLMNGEVYQSLITCDMLILGSAKHGMHRVAHLVKEVLSRGWRKGNG